MKQFAYKIFVFTSISLFLIYYFRAALPFIEYEINKEYITENLCQNKDKPMMNCKGKCYLKKEIKKAEKQDGKQNLIIKIKNTLLFNLINETIEDFNCLSEIYEKNTYKKIYSFQYVSKLLKPPQLFL